MTDTAIIHVIAGPTASGKSALALSKARDFDGVIINADSMQIYDAMPMLTAQPSPEDKAAAPHALYGVLAQHEKCSAGRWRAMAIAEIEKTLAQGKTPIVAGGSGLYIKALMEGFSPIPDVPADIRMRVTQHFDAIGAEAFYAELKKRDPVMAARFHPHHSARILRAYEVIEATGTSLSVFQDMPKENPPAHWRFHVTRVMPEKQVLDKRCDARFDAMMERGVLDEVRVFYASHAIPDDALIHRALGAAPLRRHLDGEISKEDAVIRAKADTRQYAKRQMTWFRHQIRPAENIILLD